MEPSYLSAPAKHKANLFGNDSITIKLLVIGMLVVVLIIPSAWIIKLIEERQERADSVVQEVTDKWSGRQTLSGPILVIPYTYPETLRGNNEVEILEKTGNAFFLPDKLIINGEISPQPLHRGIFETVVYSTSLDVRANFSYPDFSALKVEEGKVLWHQAFLAMAITDIGGISASPVITAGGSKLITEPSGNVGFTINQYVSDKGEGDSRHKAQDTRPSSTGITANLPWQSKDDFTGTVFAGLNLRGSRRLSFTPAGKETIVNLKGQWSDPSFVGEFLPEKREVSKDNFSAQWNILHFNRPFSQQWTGLEEKLVGSEFGLKLLVPVEQYQKSIRTAKYTQLIIILTFVALLLVEIICKIRIHPFQYTLIGAALIIYYTLLVSISEHLGFTTAYWIATIATVTLISLYATSFLEQSKLIILLTSLLSTFYAFIFVIILQQDLSLLIGSIGLFFIVATLMYFSRNVTWYK